jgi:hypothetical protein
VRRSAEACGCRCHHGGGVTYCCPECEPEAYDSCEACGEERYKHNADEREGSPGACALFEPAGFVPDIHTLTIPGVE